jgi:membrane-associated phospholipid phosphatase
MFEWLQHIDAQLFSFINIGTANPLFDTLMPLVRNRFVWSPLYVFVAAFLVINFKSKGWKMIVFAIITVIITDQLSSSFLKPLFHRIRPCHDLSAVEYVRLLVNCGGGFSMPSSHAANHFGIAMFFIALFPNKWVLMWATFWAALVGFAQVYVGVHYPFDIFCGMMAGLLCGWMTATWCKRFIV